jgi:nucleoside-diphosphate-sugar epimerase
VTGATGFVGRAVVPQLAARRDIDVAAVLRRPGARMPDRVAAIAGPDLGPTADWRPVVEGASAVVHLAARVHVMQAPDAESREAFLQTNTAGTLRLAQQAADAGVRRFVFLSSVKVNGEAGVFTETDAPAPADAYAISKCRAEEGLRELSGATGLEVTIIRPPLIYGPGVKANFHSLMRAVALGIPLPFGRVDNRRSLVGLDNLSHFIGRCLDHPAAANQTFLVSDGDDLSTPDLIRRLAGAMGRTPRLVPVPESWLRAVAGIAGKQAQAQRLLGSLQVDIAKARRLLDWTPPVPVDEGLRRAVTPR